MPRILAPPALVGHADDDLAVEPAGPAQRLIDRLGPVGRGDHHQIGARLHPVHQRQELRDQPLLRSARTHLTALGRDRVDLVDEDDRGRGLARFLENLAQPRLGFAIGGPHDLGAVDQEELRIRFIGDGAGQPASCPCPAAHGAAPLGGSTTQPLEQLGIAERQLDHLAQLVDRRRHAADYRHR